MSELQPEMWWTICQERSAVEVYFGTEMALRQERGASNVHGSRTYRLARPEEARAAYAGLRAAFGAAAWDAIRAQALEKAKSVYLDEDDDGVLIPHGYTERVDENPYALRVMTSTAATALFDVAPKAERAKETTRHRR